MKIEKSSLAAALLELGEENAAVLLELVATAAELLPTDAERGQQLQQTISRRCAKLVDQWTSSTTLRRARGATHS